MKKFLGILVLGLFLVTPSQADDIRDFQIEGMSIGDSLLDYFSADKIEEKKKKGFVYKNKEFYSATFYTTEKFELYDAVQFHLKASDKKYIIYSISGRMYFQDRISECHKKMNEVFSDIKQLFKDAKVIDDDTKNTTSLKGYVSVVKSIYITTDIGDEIAIQCYDHEPEANIFDGLNLAIDSKEFVDWLYE